MKTKEFWSEEVTAPSWKRLLEIAKEFDFILIGGWAAYLWTRAHKSKDIDIVIDYATLDSLRNRFSLVKNERLRKYEIKEGQFDIDIYVSHYSKLAVPIETLSKHTTKIEGIKTVTSEMLVILKQGAEIERRASIKGRKDAIDILLLLICSGFDIKKYRTLLRECGLVHFEKELDGVVRRFSGSDLGYLGIDHQRFVKWKKGFLAKLAG